MAPRNGEIGDCAVILLDLPWPPSVLNPNARAHWATKAKAAKSYKSDCFYLAKQFRPKFPKGEIYMKLEFYPPNNRFDSDNIESMFKAGRDGIADAWGINDCLFNPIFKIRMPAQKPGKIIAHFLTK